MPISNRTRGFSLIELMVVVAIIVIVAAIAIPNVMRGIREYRLTSAAGETSDMLLAARTHAIRENRRIAVIAQGVGNRTQLWVELSNPANGTPDPGEPYMLTPEDVVFAPTGAPAAASTGLANTGAPTNNCIEFAARGTVDFGGACGGGANPFVYFITLGYQNQPTYGFRAVTLTPVGRARTWTAADGGNWH